MVQYRISDWIVWEANRYTLRSNTLNVSHSQDKRNESQRYNLQSMYVENTELTVKDEGNVVWERGLTRMNMGDSVKF